MVESLEYEVIRRFDDLEVRRYPRITLATVRELEDDDAFGILFSFIAGENSTGRKIPMTSPVLSSEFDSGAAEGPTQPTSSRRWFSFAMPDRYTSATVPSPSDSRVEVEVVPERHVAVLRFSGRSRPKDVSVMVQKLQFATRYAGLSAKGPPFLMRYNSPFMPGFLRRNEVALEVDYSK